MISNVALHKSKNGVLAPYWDSALIEKTASGSVASFSDGGDGMPMVSVLADIDAVQDLHGQSSPYPAGGGVNLWKPISGTHRGITFAPQSDGTVKISGTMDSNGWPQVFEDYSLADLGLSVGDSVYCYADGTVGMAMRFLDADLQQISQVTRNATGTVPANTAIVRLIEIGAMVTAPSQGDVINTVGKFEWLKGSSAPASWTPYENICPISGWDSVNVTRSGKNLLPTQNLNKTTNGITIVSNNGVYTLSGTSTAFTQFFGNDNFTLPAGNYVLNSNGGIPNNTVSAQIRSVDGSTTYASSSDSGVAFTLTEATEVMFRIVVWSGKTIDVTLKPQLEVGSTASAFEPYVGHTYPTTLPQTVYGGTLDLVSGVLTIDKASETYNGTETWTEYTARNGFYIKPTGMLIGSRLAGLSNRLPNASTLSDFGLTFGANNNNTLYASEITTTISGVSDVASWKTWLASNPLQVVYPLAEPQTIQLSKTEVDSLLADNNLWADSGNIAVTYRADSTLAYEQLTNAIVSLGGNI